MSVMRQMAAHVNYTCRSKKSRNEANISITSDLASHARSVHINDEQLVTQIIAFPVTFYI